MNAGPKLATQIGAKAAKELSLEEKEKAAYNSALRLQLARALVLSGDTVKARGVYNDLLALWKNADPDIRVLKDAQAEYARLP